jgi:hypothetical protein
MIRMMYLLLSYVNRVLRSSTSNFLERRLGEVTSASVLVLVATGTSHS